MRGRDRLLHDHYELATGASVELAQNLAGLGRGISVDGFLRLHMDLRGEKVTQGHDEQGTRAKGSTSLEHRLSLSFYHSPFKPQPAARQSPSYLPLASAINICSGIFFLILDFRLLIIEARILNSHLAFFYFKVFLLLPPHLIFTLYDHLGRHCQRVRSSPWPRRKYIL